MVRIIGLILSGVSSSRPNRRILFIIARLRNQLPELLLFEFQVPVYRPAFHAERLDA